MDGNGQNGGNNKYSTFVLFLLASIAIMVMYVEAMAFPSLPQVMADFGLGPEDYSLASWIVTIYLVVGAVSIPVFGKLGDIYGKKKMLVYAMVIYTIMVTVTGFSRELSGSIYLMIVFRALQGIAMCMFPLAFSLIRDEFPRDKIAIAQGVISAMFGVGTAVGFVLGGYVTDALGWQWTYHTVAPFALLVTVTVMFKVRESPVRLKAKVDYVGAALLGATMVAFLVGITETRERGWTDLLVVGLLVLAAVFIFTFVLWIRRAQEPLVRPALMKVRNLALVNVVGFIIGFAMFSTSQTVASLAGFNFRLDAVGIGLLMLPVSIVTLFFGPTVGLLVRRIGPKWPMTLGMVLSIAGFATLYQFHYTQLEVALSMAVMGAGSAFAMVASINMVIISTPIEETGISTAISMIVRTSGSVVGPAVAAVIIAQNSSYDSSIGAVVPEDVAYQAIFMISAVAAGIGAIISMYTEEKKKEPEEAPKQDKPLDLDSLAR